MPYVKNKENTKPSAMTRQQFDELAQKIKNRNVNDTHGIDYDRWEDAAGNWYTRTDAGFSQTIFYAGTTYFVKYRYVPGKTTESSISIWEYV